MAELEGAEVVAVPKVPIHHAPKESPRKHRGRPPKSVGNVVPESPEPPAVAGMTPLEPPRRRSHALDHAPVGSSLVVVETTPSRKAVMSTPDGVKVLPEGDEAHLLPVGAKIRKLADHQYRSTQLNPSDVHEDVVHETAVEAIGAFIEHFHPDWRQP